MTEPAETQPPVDGAPATKPKRRLPLWIMAVLGAGCALGTTLGIALAVIFASYNLPSASMWPTLTVGERLFANRTLKEPVRGAIMVFRYPEHPKQSFARRVIGLPGDVITVAHGEPTINGWKVPRCPVGRASYRDTTGPGDGGKHEGLLAVEYLGVAAYLVFDDSSAIAASESGPWTVKAGEYFVLGDNRNNSHDSRTWFGGQGGGVPVGDTVGRVRSHDTAFVPQGAEELGPALAACLAKRPAQTEPPAPAR